MKIRKKYLLISLFIFLEIFLGFYITNFTFRIKQLAGTYRSVDEITCISVTPTGTLLCIGGKNGSITLFKNGISIPLWRYHGNFDILSIKLSAESDYIVAQDSNDTISLFSQTPNLRGNKIHPLWEHYLPACKIRDIYSTGGIFPSVYILASSEGSLHLLSKTGERIWEYQTGSDGVTAAISRDGQGIAVGDLNGNVYLFKTESEKPLWIFPTDAKIESIAISYDTNYVVAGGETKDGKGHIFFLSFRDGELLYDRLVDSPIRTVYISYDGKSVIADKDDDTALAILYDEGKISENALDIQKRIESIMPSVFGSNVVISAPNEVYLFYLPRPTPLWRFSVKEGTPRLAITQEGESIFVSNSHTIYFLSNTKFSEIIPGSRIGWAVIFFLGVVALFLNFIMNGRINLAKIKKSDYLSAMIALSAGAIVGMLILNDIGKAILICGIGTFVGNLFCWRNRCFLSYLSGCYLGFMGSVVAGSLLGLLIWFNGDERNIIQLILENLYDGITIGVLIGPFGATVGTFFMSLIISKIMHFVN